ncbi:MAG: autotransporter outer membrane beta-barrel domain-containing protein [Puniceicoccales bacterium]|jgi:hypothetical protein|nr:autotransporter outer membrane beta-barrel domain-containing protein [Puniceicoccales bacterium]
MGRKRTFPVLMAIIGCLIFNFNLKLIGASELMDDILIEAAVPAIVSIVYPIIGEELASLTVSANNLLTNALSSRMTNVKGCLADPFVHAVYGRIHRNNIVSKCDYKNDMYGLVLGVDNVWTFDDEKYFRLGTALGYIRGKTTPSGSLSRVGQDPTTTFSINLKQFIAGRSNDTYAIKLFGAYESFDDKCLKTNIGVILGYSHNRDEFHVKNPYPGTPSLDDPGTPPSDDTGTSTSDGLDAVLSEILRDISRDESTSEIFKDGFDVKFVSHSIFLGVEFIKNLYAYDGYQFGLWLQANYGHIFQRTNEILSGKLNEVLPVKPDSIKLEHDFLATVVGLNVEKETFKHGDKKLTLSLRTGWECRIIQSFDLIRTATVFASAAVFNDVNKFLRYPVRNSAVILFSASQKLNTHWSIVGSYSARFNRNISAHSLSGGIEYSF